MSVMGKYLEVLNIIPGLAPLFDYEWFPQKTRWSNLTPTIEIIGGIHIRGMDGLICASSPAFEAPAIAAARNWYMSLWKIWHNRNRVQSDTEKRGVEFETQNEFGEKSLVYVGELYYLELVDSKTPFFFTDPSPWMTLPSELEAKIAGNYLIPSCNWMVHHSRRMEQHSGGVLPSSSAADQPYNAILMSRNHQAAFELISVRTGDRGCAYPTNSKMPSFTPESAKEEFRALLN
ncbi:hypothetical protein F5879DRAFT_1021111 [Lentinula edodes]|nr:hypothetical protein F5879DRAFT_1021111 [Lentinula edodes]